MSCAHQKELSCRRKPTIFHSNSNHKQFSNDAMPRENQKESSQNRQFFIKARTISFENAKSWVVITQGKLATSKTKATSSGFK
jgi:hypothetical protein